MIANVLGLIAAAAIFSYAMVSKRKAEILKSEQESDESS